MKSESGFTLIELLISIALLGMISIAIYQAMFGTYRLRDTLLVDGEFYNEIRLAQKVIERDFALMYSPMAFITLGAPNEEDLIREAGVDRPNEFWMGAAHHNGVRPSRFNGEEKKLSFITLGHMKISREVRETDFERVSYELDQDKYKDAIPGTQILIRKASPNVFTEDFNRDEMQKQYVLLHGIKKLKFRYQERKKTDFVNAWDTFTTNFRQPCTANPSLQCPIYPAALELQI